MPLNNDVDSTTADGARRDTPISSENPRTEADNSEVTQADQGTAETAVRQSESLDRPRELGGRRGPRMVSLIGTARNVEFIQPSALGRFVGNNSVLFFVATDTPFVLPDGGNLNLVPVRLDCFARLPKFDDFEVEIVGEYDDFDKLFRCHGIEIKKLAIGLGGVKYRSLRHSVGLVCTYILFSFCFLAFGLKLISKAATFEDAWVNITISYLLLFLILGVIAAVGIYVKRVAGAVIWESCDRLLRRVSEYRRATLEAVEQEQTTMRRRQRVAAIIVLASVAGLVAWLNWSRIEQQISAYRAMRYKAVNVDPYVLTPEVERALKPLTSFRECLKDCPEMVVIPAGSFTMGSPETERGRNENESPQHLVTIAKPFAVSKFDVTYADWNACVSVGGCPEISASDLEGDTSPLINVSWNQARQYAEWFSKMTGKSYRLLTEAEWEYAARAGSTTAFFWGDEIGENNANCRACGSQWDGRRTAPDHSSQTGLACMIWRAMFGSGWKIAIKAITTGHR
jgi:formylglycine-generating enzyme required for sulfatase activity